VDAVVCADHFLTAVLLQTGCTLLTVAHAAQAGVVLSTNANTVTDLNVPLGLGTNADGDTDDFVADTTGVYGGALDGLASYFTMHVEKNIPIRFSECADQSHRYQSG
jgi:hypothetical protein